MFSIFKLIIWLSGVLAITYFALPYFGYTINMSYWKESRNACQEKLNQCRKDLVSSGIKGAKEKCDWKCIDPKLILKEQDEKGDIIEGTPTQ